MHSGAPARAKHMHMHADRSSVSGVLSSFFHFSFYERKKDESAISQVQMVHTRLQGGPYRTLKNYNAVLYLCKDDLEKKARKAIGVTSRFVHQSRRLGRNHLGDYNIS